MHRSLLIAAAAAAVLASGALTPDRANAFVPGAPIAVPPAAEKVAVCFYVDGWHGPGFYECGFRFRRGEGWVGERREERREERRREERREEHREDRREDRRDDRR
jgi:hypothetical protein